MKKELKKTFSILNIGNPDLVYSDGTIFNIELMSIGKNLEIDPEIDYEVNGMVSIMEEFIKEGVDFKVIANGKELTQESFINLMKGERKDDYYDLDFNIENTPELNNYLKKLCLETGLEINKMEFVIDEYEEISKLKSISLSYKTSLLKESKIIQKFKEQTPKINEIFKNLKNENCYKFYFTKNKCILDIDFTKIKGLELDMVSGLVLDNKENIESINNFITNHFKTFKISRVEFKSKLCTLKKYLLIEKTSIILRSAY